MHNSQPEAREEAVAVRILLVDDHPLLRERLREVIEKKDGFAVCGEAEDRAGALERVAETRPDLAVVDLSLKNSSGMELIKDLRSRFPEIRILVLSMHDEVVYAERAMRAGASGYITKQEAGSKVLDAIKSVMEGACYLPPAIAQQILAQRLGRPKVGGRSGVEALSDRELEVFRGLAKGQTTRQIAEVLHLDVKTVETYRSRLKDKLGYHNATELVQAAIAWGRTQTNL